MWVESKGCFSPIKSAGGPQQFTDEVLCDKFCFVPDSDCTKWHSVRVIGDGRNNALHCLAKAGYWTEDRVVSFNLGPRIHFLLVFLHFESDRYIVQAGDQVWCCQRDGLFGFVPKVNTPQFNKQSLSGLCSFGVLTTPRIAKKYPPQTTSVAW